jgi:hypothetical protein
VAPLPRDLYKDPAMQDTENILDKNSFSLGEDFRKVTKGHLLKERKRILEVYLGHADPVAQQILFDFAAGDSPTKIRSAHNISIGAYNKHLKQLFTGMKVTDIESLLSRTYGPVSQRNIEQLAVHFKEERKEILKELLRGIVEGNNNKKLKSMLNVSGNGLNELYQELHTALNVNSLAGVFYRAYINTDVKEPVLKQYSQPGTLLADTKVTENHI